MAPIPSLRKLKTLVRSIVGLRPNLIPLALASMRPEVEFLRNIESYCYTEGELCTYLS